MTILYAFRSPVIFHSQNNILQLAQPLQTVQTALHNPLPSMADEQKPKAKPVVARQGRVRLTLLVYRKQGMSLEEFQQYWKNEHSHVFSSIAIVKKNLLSYEQVREASIQCFQSMTSQGLIFVQCLCRLMSTKK